MSHPLIDWNVAERVAVRVGGHEPFSSSYHYTALDTDFERFTAQAEELVGIETGLRSLSGPARGRVATRAGWVRANISSFQRLLKPMTDRFEGRVGGPMAPAMRRVAGAEVGALLGWMSTRVLGQYDLLVVEDDNPEDQDIVYYVGPNVLGLEKKHGFPPDEFRLWLALQEVTHRAQFTGIPWMRGHFLSLVEQTMSLSDPDPGRLVHALGRVTDSIRGGHNPLDDGGLAAVFASPEQKAVLDQIGGLMSLLEGHGDVTMDRAGKDHVPSAGRFGAVLRNRRAAARGLSRVLQRLIGIEAKLLQYQAGEEFIEVVEDHGGTGLIDRAWERPENLPSMDEIRDPQVWIDRVGLRPAA